MQTIAMVGTYSSDVLRKMNDLLHEDFNIIEVQKYDEYFKLECADYIILRKLKLDRDVIKSLRHTKLIHRWGSGYDTVDIETAGKCGIPVLIASGINSAAVSEHAILLMLSLYRHVITLNNLLVQGIWKRQEFIEQSYMVKGKTLGLLGCGNVGRLVAEKAQVFGAKIIYYDISRLSPEIERNLGIRFVPLDELYSTSDIISIHVPALDNTIGMIGKGQFEMMKSSAILINTARGSIINEPDLIEALQSKKIFGAGLDSYAVEPLPKDSPLLTMNNVVLTPHIGGNTKDLEDEMICYILENIRKKQNGEELPHQTVVNSQYLI